MASDIRISELNEINVNSNVNEIIINSRESSNDTGISKKIQVANFLTDSIVKTNNLDNLSVTTDKLAGQAITANKIADKTITNSQIADRTITNSVLDDNSVDNRVLDNGSDYTVRGITATSSVASPAVQVSNRLSVSTGQVTINSIPYNFPSTEVPRNFLRTDGSGNLTWAEAVPGDGTALVFSDTSPVGTIIPWAGGQSSIPDDKWINLFSERRFLGSTYPELRDLLGTQWGPRTNQAGVETPTGAYYALPDLRARAVLGAGEGNDGTDSCTTAFATYGGKYRHTLDVTEMPAHQHTLFGNDRGTSSGQLYAPGLFKDDAERAASDSNTIQPTGGGLPHNNTQPYVAMSYIIKAKPDDIQQYNVNVGPGLSALDAQSTQTAFVNLSSTQIGLKVTDDFQFDGSGRLKISTPIGNLLTRNIVQNINRYRYTFYGRDTAGWTPIYTGPSSGGTQPEMSVTITPKFSTSKLLVSFNVHAGGDNHSPAIKLFRNGAEIPELICINPESTSRFKDATSTGSFEQYYTAGVQSFKFLDDNGGSGFTAGVPVVYSLKQSAYYSGYLYTINGGRTNNVWTPSVVSTIEAEEIYL